MSKPSVLTLLSRAAGAGFAASLLLGCGQPAADAGRSAAPAATTTAATTTAATTTAATTTAATTTAATTTAATTTAATTTVSVSQLPTEAQQTLQLIHRGGPFPFRKDGAVFANREQLLPQRPRGYYTEYTVRTPDTRDRGARRIVAGRGTDGDPGTSGEYYYTEDHYNTFRRIRE